MPAYLSDPVMRTISYEISLANDRIEVMDTINRAYIGMRECLCHPDSKEPIHGITQVDPSGSKGIGLSWGCDDMTTTLIYEAVGYNFFGVSEPFHSFLKSMAERYSQDKSMRECAQKRLVKELGIRGL